jgi:hypothetical protein
MFGFDTLLGNVVKTAASVVAVPVAAAVDVVTLGGEITETAPATPEALENVVQNLTDLVNNE